MDTPTPFKWRHFEAEIILLCVCWYLRYPPSYRDLEEMMFERGLHVGHTTIYRWLQHYAPEMEKRCRSHLKATNDSWRVDETYIKVKKVWTYPYRAVDSQGNTLEFLLTPTRDAQAAKRFFSKALAAPHTSTCFLQGKIGLPLLFTKEASCAAGAPFRMKKDSRDYTREERSPERKRFPY
jgi:transposase, IS6 family